MTEDTLWHSISAAEAVSRLRTDAAAGLTGAEAAARLGERGPNLLREKPPRSPWLILWEQFNSALMMVLAAAAVIAFLTHDRGDAAVIAAILVLNAALGFWQEYKADRAMEALKKMAAPSVRVVRGGRAGEIMVMFVSPFLGMPLALLPAQLLWMNLVTDGLPALAIGVQPAEAGVMRRPPRRTDRGVFTRGMTAHIIWSSALMCAVSLGAGWHYWRAGDPAWQTMLFTTLTFSQLAQALTVSPGRDFFAARALKNPKLLGAVALSAVMQTAVIYAPFMREFFRTVPLSGADLALASALAAAVFLSGELAKYRGRC